ncbi:MAG: hypothetical protein RLZZ136_499, partial [Pseudomonadota bacterium]
VWSHIYPGNGQVTSDLTLASAADVDAAVAAARAAFPAWRALPGNRRRDLLLKLAEVIERNAPHLSALAVIENGTPSAHTHFAVQDGLEKYRYFAGWADKIEGRTIDTWTGPAHDYTHYEPYGVIGAIVPWNGPFFAANMVLAPALAAGNCVVLKAPELAPYSVMKLGEMIREAGFPDGVVNVLVGGPDAGDAMVRHKGVDKVQFVGSGATARKVLMAASEQLKPCGLELGGKSAVIVFDDADLMSAAQRGLSGAVAVSGQGCVNGTRVLVQRAIYEHYLQALQGIVPYIPVGDPLDPNTVMGPLITEASLNRISGMIETARAEGGRVLTGGERIRGDHAAGFYLPLTIIADVDNRSHLARNEVFGPVLAVTPFDTEEEAIALANDSDFGLGAYVHTQSLRRAHVMASALQAGMIQVNGAGEGMAPCAPFGGYKQSGYGRLGGEAGLHEFLQIKNVWVNLAKQGGEA